MLNINDNIIVNGTVYGNDVGRAVVLNPDYKGFPAKKGLLVKFLDRPDHVGFIHHGNYIKVKSLDPTRKVSTTPKPDTNKTREDLQIIINKHAKNEENIFFETEYKAQSFVYQQRGIRPNAEVITPDQLLQGQVRNAIATQRNAFNSEESSLEGYNPFPIEDGDTLYN